MLWACFAAICTEAGGQQEDIPRASPGGRAWSPPQGSKKRPTSSSIVPAHNPKPLQAPLSGACLQHASTSIMPACSQSPSGFLAPLEHE